MLAAGKIGVCFVDVGTSATSVPCALPTDSERVPLSGSQARVASTTVICR